MDNYCKDCIHNEVCRYEANCPTEHCNDKETITDIIERYKTVNSAK